MEKASTLLSTARVGSKYGVFLISSSNVCEAPLRSNESASDTKLSSTMALASASLYSPLYV